MIKNITTLFFLVILTSIFQNGVSAQGGEIIVKDILDDLEQRMESLMESAEYRTNNVVNNAGINATYAIRQFRVEYSNVLNESLNGLDDLQRKSLNNLQLKANDIIRNIERKLFPQLEQSVNQLGNFMLSLPFAKDKSFVSGVKFPLIISNGTKDIKVEITGAKLSHKDNYFRFKGNRLTHNVVSDNRVILIIPYSLIGSSISQCEMIETIEFFTHYVQDRTWPAKDITHQIKYNPILRVVSPHVANFTLNYRIENSKEIFKVRTHRMKLEIDNSTWGGKTGETSNSFVPSDGYYFRPDQPATFAKISEWECCNGGEQRAWIENLKPTGFVVKLKGKTDRKYKCGRCIYEVDVTFKEFKIDVTREDKTTKIKSLLFDNEMTLQLDDNTSSFNFAELFLCDGERIVLDKSGIYKDFIEIIYNSNNKVVVLRALK